MGGLNTKEEIIARLNNLDREEILINKQLRELQIELNGIVPVKDRVKVKKEYFDNISMGEIEKHQEHQNSSNDSNDIDDENLEDLEKEKEEEEDEDVSKKRKKKKIKIKSKSAKKITKKNRK